MDGLDTKYDATTDRVTITVDGKPVRDQESFNALVEKIVDELRRSALIEGADVEIMK
jgi:hypothetical protein